MRLSPISTDWISLYRAFSRLALIALLFSAGSRLSCSQTEQNTNDLPDAISGTVLNSVTHEPIGRALVYTNDQRFAVFTDDRGHFELNLTESPPQPEGRLQRQSSVVLEARKPGFLSASRAQGQMVNLREQKGVTISLVPEGLIVGKVRFPAAEAGDQVQVRLYRCEVSDGRAQWVPLTEVPTRADGEFRFAELRAGEYKLFTREALERDPLTTNAKGPVFGFPPRFFANARDFASADTIQVRPGETVTADLAPARERYYEVKVPVITAGPAEWFEVAVDAQGHRGPGFELGYDPDQHAIRGSLPNGTYTVEASSAEPSAATGISSITVANGAVNAPPITLAANPSVQISVRQDLTGAEHSQMQAPHVYVNLQSAEEVTNDRGLGGSYQTQNAEGC